MKRIVAQPIGLHLNFLIFIFGVLSFIGCKKSDSTPPPTAVINSFSPVQGIAGDQVTITGENFGNDINAVQVKFNGSSATVKSITSTQLIITAPQNVTSGKISVTVNGTTVTSTTDFTVVGVVATVAGNTTAGYADGIGTSAKFMNPTDLALDQSGNMYVTSNYRIRKITSNGTVTTLAGSGSSSFADGTGTAAGIGVMLGITIDKSGNLYVCDLDNNCIRKITAAGEVTTITSHGFGGYADGPVATAKFYTPMGIAIDSLGNIFVADAGNNRIRKISASGTVSTVAGNSQEGLVDGIGSAASFRNPQKVKIDKDGNLIVLDGNNCVRKITLSSGSVTTIAGNGLFGFADGNAQTAEFSAADGMCLDNSGNIYIGDTGNNRIRKISVNGNVTTIAGGAAGYLDGAVTMAQFYNPCGLDIDSKGIIYVTDNENNCIRKITP